MTAITAATTTVAERAQRIEEAIHSAAMEGLSVSPAWRAEAQEFIEGRIDSDELVARTRARYGLV